MDIFFQFGTLSLNKFLSFSWKSVVTKHHGLKFVLLLTCVEDA